MNGEVDTERMERGALLVLLTLLVGAAWTASLPLALLSGLGGAAMAARRRAAPVHEGGVGSEWGADTVSSAPGRAPTTGEPDSVDAMRLTLRRLEAELYALDDQRLTDRAGGHGDG